MRSWFLLLASVLDILTSLSLATPSLHNEFDPFVHINSQQQPNGPSVLSGPPNFQRSLPPVLPVLMTKRNGIHVQELNQHFLLQYRAFYVSALTRGLPKNKTCSGKDRCNSVSSSFLLQKTLNPRG